MHVSVRVIRDMIKGSEAAFTTVYEAYHKYIYYIIYTYVSDVETTKDLTQDAFIKMYKDIGQLQDPPYFHQWFITLSKRIAIDHIRKESKGAFVLDGQKAIEEVVDYTYSPSPGILSFKTLSDDELKIMNYKIIYKTSFKDIAELMDMTLSVVTKVYYKAIKKLKKEMEVL